MAWTIEYTDTAKKSLKKLDKAAARQIVDYMRDRVGKREDPKSLGKPLSGPLGGLWRYRVGDYRVVCEISEQEIRVLVLRIGHRGAIYAR